MPLQVGGLGEGLLAHWTVQALGHPLAQVDLPVHVAALADDPTRLCHLVERLAAMLVAQGDRTRGRKHLLGGGGPRGLGTHVEGGPDPSAMGQALVQTGEDVALDALGHSDCLGTDADIIPR